jgi:cytochrome c556
MKKTAIVTALMIALSTAGIALADDKNEDAIKARKAAFTLMVENVKPMGGMAKGKMPFDKEQFAMRAANLKALSDMPWEFFIPGSGEGETKAKPEVWSDPEGYKAAADKFKQEVAKLVEATSGDDEKAMIAQYGKTAKTCKSCHKEYKQKRD